MEISAITAASNESKWQAAPASFSSQDFMKLLIAQLQNQDPLNPMDSKEFLGQLAQLETVAGLNELRETVNGYAQMAGLMQPVGLLGRTVRWMGEGGWEQGTVEAVRLEANRPVVVVDGKEIEVSQIREVL